MAYDEKLAARVRAILGDRLDVREQKMFGGPTFMVAGYMCCGVHGDDLIVRLDPDREQAALARPHARPMDLTHRPMRGLRHRTTRRFQRPSTPHLDRRGRRPRNHRVNYEIAELSEPELLILRSGPMPEMDLNHATIARIELGDDGGRTRLTLTDGPTPDDGGQGAGAGWGGAFNKLDAALAATTRG